MCAFEPQLSKNSELDTLHVSIKEVDAKLRQRILQFKALRFEFGKYNIMEGPMLFLKFQCCDVLNNLRSFFVQTSNLFKLFYL